MALVAAGLVLALPGTPAGATPPEAAAAAAPKLRTLVVFRSGKSIERRVRAARTRVKVDGRRCAVGARTPLAALRRLGPGRTVFEDFGACSRRPRDAGGLYVKRMRGDGEVGPAGWVYKVGRKTPGIGAADPVWRLRRGQRVLWFWCLQSGNCQRNLEVSASVGEDDVVSARVRGYDDHGRGVPVEGATVTIGEMQVTTDAAGLAQATVGPGAHTVRATKPGMVRSFSERVRVP